MDGFHGLVEMLRSASLEPFDPANKADRDWISPVVLKEDAVQRRVEDIEYLAPFVCLDLDAPGWSLARLRDALQGLRMIVYTTASSTLAHPRWRLIVALDRTYSVAEHRRVWKWFNLALNGEVDTQTKDASRISYFPAQYTGANNQFHVFDGIKMEIDVVLLQMPADEPPRPVAPASLNVPSGQIQLIEQWMVDKEFGRPTGGRMWRIMCRATARFKRNEWTLTPQQLADAFMAVNHLIAPSDRRINIIHDAENAILWASRNVETTPQTYFQWRI